MKYGRAAMALAMFTAVIIISVIVLHELGHFAAGSVLGCDSMRIILLDDAFGTYTQMSCSLDGISSALLHLSGFLFVVPFALALLVFRTFERNFFLISLGFNIIISASDLQMFSAQVLYASLAAGLFFVIYGENMLINSYMKYMRGPFLMRRQFAE